VFKILQSAKKSFIFREIII